MILLATALIVSLVFEAASPADAWTWSSATHRAGSANVGGSSSGGGLYLYKGHYYIPGAGHVDHTPGADVNEQGSGTGYLGHVTHTTNKTRRTSA